MDDEAAKSGIESFINQLKYEEMRIRSLSREEAEAVSQEQMNEIADTINKVVEDVGYYLARLEYDLRYILKIVRGFRAMRKRIKSLFSHRKTRVRLAITASAVTIAGTTATTVHHLYGWSKVLAWLAKIFTGQ